MNKFFDITRAVPQNLTLCSGSLTFTLKFIHLFLTLMYLIGKKEPTLENVVKKPDVVVLWHQRKKGCILRVHLNAYMVLCLVTDSPGNRLLLSLNIFGAIQI